MLDHKNQKGIFLTLCGYYNPVFAIFMKRYAIGTIVIWWAEQAIRYMELCEPD